MFVKIQVKTLTVNATKKLSLLYQIICTNTLKVASKKIFQKAAEEASDLVCNEIADEIIKVSKRSPQSSSETAESETEKTGFDREKPKERYMSPEKKDSKLLMI